MSSQKYVWEKMYMAIDSLCSEGPFSDRLKNATKSGLLHLKKEDLTGKLAEDLKFVLGWTKDNMNGGEIQKVPDELERRELIHKMLHIMLETQKKDV
jgi:hypothetical protein